MQLSHTPPARCAVFDHPNLVSSPGLVPLLALAESAGLRNLTQQHLTVPGDKGANAGLKVASVVAGMVAGADSIDGMALLRHGGMGRVFAHAYAPSTLGSFLRAFTFGHVRQLDAVASRFLTRLADQVPLLGTRGDEDHVLADVDDTIIKAHLPAKASPEREPVAGRLRQRSTPAVDTFVPTGRAGSRGREHRVAARRRRSSICPRATRPRRREGVQVATGSAAG
jgi:hypothetical protein